MCFSKFDFFLVFLSVKRADLATLFYCLTDGRWQHLWHFLLNIYGCLTLEGMGHWKVIEFMPYVRLRALDLSPAWIQLHYLSIWLASKNICRIIMYFEYLTPIHPVYWIIWHCLDISAFHLPENKSSNDSAVQWWVSVLLKNKEITFKLQNFVIVFHKQRWYLRIVA